MSAQPPTAPIPRLGLSRTEAAASLGVSIDSFERHVQPTLRLVRRGRMRIVPIAELERWLAENAERTLRRALAGLVEAGEVRAVEGGYELAERGANGELAPLAPPEPASGATASPIGGPAGTPGTPGANGDGTPGTPPTNAILGADFTEEGSA